MKAVKITASCLLTVLLFLIYFLYPVPSPNAYALDGRYGRADARDIYIYERADENYALFTIPYTYCVEILSKDGNWYHVRYAENTEMYESIYGYCLADKLTVIDTPPENIYLNMTVPLTFKTDAPIGSLPTAGELTVSAAFYGNYYSGGTAYSYVRYDKKYFYVSGIDDNYPLNEIGTEPEPEPETHSDNKAIIAIAIAVFAVGAILVLYFASRKSKIFNGRG